MRWVSLLPLLGQLELGWGQGSPPLIQRLQPDNGPSVGGTPLQIVGENLGANQTDLASITVGEEECLSPVYSSPNLLSCTSPQGSPGDAPVVVTTLSGGASEPFTFTYNHPPFVSAVSPNNGPAAGGTLVTIQGSNLGQMGADLLSATLAGVPCQTFDYTNSTLVRCLTGTAQRPLAGSIILVTASGGEGTSNVSYTYNSAPSIDSIVPNSGPWTGREVSLLGKNLGTGQADVLSVLFFGTASCRSIVWVSGAEIRCRAPSMSPRLSGSVVVTTASGGASNSNITFTYNPAPRVLEVEPSNGPAVGGDMIVISGSDFGDSPANLLRVSIKGEACLEAELISDTVVHCVTPPNTPGKGDINVTTLTGGPSILSLATYTYNEAPLVQSVSPDIGPQRGGTRITIKGLHIGNHTGDVQEVTIGSTRCIDISFLEQQGLQCTTQESTDNGAVPVVVITYAGGPSNDNVTFTFVRAPHVGAIDPESGPQGGGTLLHIDGDDFGESQEEIVSVSVANVECGQINRVSRSQLICVTGESNSPRRGPVLVTTLYGGQGTSSKEFTYNAAPYVLSVTPNNGPQTGGTWVRIVGNYLGNDMQDIKNVTLDGLPCTNVSLINEAETPAITCTTAPKTVQSTRGGPVIVATVSGGTSNTNVLFFYNPAPEVSFVSPDNGPESGGTFLTISGRNLGLFKEDLLEVRVSGSLCSDIVLVSSVRITCTTQQGVSPGSGPIVVTTISGGSGQNSSNALFTYNQAPLVTEVTPSSVPSTGFQTVVIRGESLGKSWADLTDVAVAGVSCLFSLKYVDETQLVCLVDSTNASFSGPVTVNTLSGGSGSSLVNFTYSLACHTLFEEASCSAFPDCSWCSRNARCLGDEPSCSQSRAASSAALSVLIVTAFASLLISVYAVLYFANRDEALLRNLRNNKLVLQESRSAASQPPLSVKGRPQGPAAGGPASDEDSTTDEEGGKSGRREQAGSPGSSLIVGLRRSPRPSGPSGRSLLDDSDSEGGSMIIDYLDQDLDPARASDNE